MRAFIAVEIPEHIQQTVGNYINEINSQLTDIKWVKPENLHLTIKFLGDITERQSDVLRGCLNNIAKDFSPFDVSLSHLGFFPSQANPKVIWLGADNGIGDLLDVFHDMEDCLDDAGFDREARTFSPHLTIGRVKRHRNVVVPDSLPEFNEVEFQVNRVALIKSTLTPDGPIYKKLTEKEFTRVPVNEI